MIFVTADTHGDIERFEDKQLKKLKKTDTLIVLGDFGFIWNDSEKTEKQDYLEDRWCGWYSPTYNEKEPALSIIVTCRGTAPFHFDTLITTLGAG